MKLKIEKLVEGGQGIGYGEDPASQHTQDKYAGQVFFVWNVLPEEEVEVEITNKRKGIYEAKVVNILKPSPHRTKQTEDHFLSCSPWQIMTEKYEGEIKLEIARETFKRIGKLSEEDIKILDIEILSNEKQFGYRNKMEYSFIEEGGKISLAFFQRGQRKKIALGDCKLATQAINETAKKILDWIHQNGLTERNLKALIVRSNMKGETIAGLFIKDKMDFLCRDKSRLVPTGKFLGFSLYYSTHKSPASVITEVLYQEGQDFLTEEINGVKLKYGINSFFQVNIPVFEMVLSEIIDSVGTRHALSLPILDFYSGVGTIGLSIAKNVNSVTLVESNEEAIGFARENIELNKIKNTEVIFAPAEKALEHIEEDKIIIFDPPRAGLHEKVIDRILEVRPPKIIYLSCNVATQARDIGMLKATYDIKFVKLYNFFPRTPHIESLAVLELKK